MPREILVSVRNDDKLNDIIPYLEKIARPGMKIVFLVHGMKNGSASDDDRPTDCPGLETETTLAHSRMARAFDPQYQKRLAEEKVLPACSTLQKMGVGIGVDLYTRSLKGSIGRHTARGEVEVLVMTAGISLKIMKFLHRRFSFRRLFQTTPASPLFVSYSQASGPLNPIINKEELRGSETWMPDRSAVARKDASHVKVRS